MIDEGFKVLDREECPPADLRRAWAAPFVDEIAQGSPRQGQRFRRPFVIQKQNRRTGPFLVNSLAHEASIDGRGQAFLAWSSRAVTRQAGIVPSL